MNSACEVSKSSTCVKRRAGVIPGAEFAHDPEQLLVMVDERLREHVVDLARIQLERLDARSVAVVAQEVQQIRLGGKVPQGQLVRLGADELSAEGADRPLQKSVRAELWQRQPALEIEPGAPARRTRPSAIHHGEVQIGHVEAAARGDHAQHGLSRPGAAFAQEVVKHDHDRGAARVALGIEMGEPFFVRDPRTGSEAACE